MTRWGVVSDVHANAAALAAAIDVLRAERVDRWISAGDAVGYGPDPNDVIETLRMLDAQSVAGNHELYLANALEGDRFVGRARASLDWTRTELNAASWRYIEALPMRLDLGEVVVAHGSLDDATEYVIRRRHAAAEVAAAMVSHPAMRWLVLGHTHQQLFVSDDGRRHPTRPSRARPLPVARTALLNPGSVGQSRQLERRAKARFMLLDTERLTATWFAVPYDDAQTRRRLVHHGLPAEWIHVRPPVRRWLLRTLRSWAQ